MKFNWMFLHFSILTINICLGMQPNDNPGQGTTTQVIQLPVLIKKNQLTTIDTQRSNEINALRTLYAQLADEKYGSLEESTENIEEQPEQLDASLQEETEQLGIPDQETPAQTPILTHRKSKDKKDMDLKNRIKTNKRIAKAFLEENCDCGDQIKCKCTRFELMAMGGCGLMMAGVAFILGALLRQKCLK